MLHALLNTIYSRNICDGNEKSHGEIALQLSCCSIDIDEKRELGRRQEKQRKTKNKSEKHIILRKGTQTSKLRIIGP